MKWVYFLSGIALFVIMLLIANPTMDLSQQSSIVELVVQDSRVPNAVSGIILRNRLYDTIL
jgi:multicomponent Na+:H+ antiporter subunit B